MGEAGRHRKRQWRAGWWRLGLGAQIRRLDVGNRGAGRMGRRTRVLSTAERERGQRGDPNHVIREQESKATGRGAFQGLRRRGGSNGGGGGRRLGGRGLV